MDPNTRPTPAPTELFNPLAGWEAASRWNATAWDWMASGWRQWMALVTTLPLHELPATPLAQRALSSDRPVARAEPKRPARARAQPKARPKARARG
jgi:hypothetical protein